MVKRVATVVVFARVYDAMSYAYIRIGDLFKMYISRARDRSNKKWTMAFDKKAWMRVYMRAYRLGKRRRPRPGYFDKKAWSRPYMREYMRKVRARQKLERERGEAINSAIARLSNPAPAADLPVTDRLARSETLMADMWLLRDEAKRRVVEAGENGPIRGGRFHRDRIARQGDEPDPEPGE